MNLHASEYSGRLDFFQKWCNLRSLHEHTVFMPDFLNFLETDFIDWMKIVWVMVKEQYRESGLGHRISHVCFGMQSAQEVERAAHLQVDL